MAHTCNPSNLGGQGRRVTCAQELESSPGNIGRPHLSPRLLRPADRKQPVPGASGKRLVNGVSASAVDSEAAAVPEPEECL